MNKSDLINEVFQRCSNHLKKDDVKEIIDRAIKQMEKSLMSGESVTLYQFGTFTPQEGRRGKGEITFYPSPSLIKALSETDRLAG